MIEEKFHDKSCKILKKIAYVSQIKRKETNILGDVIEVLPTFCYNPDSKTSPKTAKTWVEEDRENTEYFWDGKKNPDYVENENKEPIFLDNDPFDIEIIDLETRYNGGRAYKVIDSKNRLFDLREDQLLDVIRLFGISPAGKIPAQFVWGVLGTQVRLVLVGGNLYNASIKFTEKEKNNEVKITGKDLVVGGVYKMKSGDKRIYLGKILAPFIRKPVYSFVCESYDQNYLVLVKEPTFTSLVKQIDISEVEGYKRNIKHIESNFLVNNFKELKEYFKNENQKDFNVVECDHKNRYGHVGYYVENEYHYACRDCYNSHELEKERIVQKYIKNIEWK